MSAQPLRVLLVDDEASLRDPLARFLARERGYIVATAADGATALACVEAAQGQLDVVLLDDLLIPAPGHDPEPLGIKLMTAIRARYPQIEFILFTGWGMDAGIEALRAGAYRYLSKPFNADELAVLIEHAAEYRRLKGAEHEKLILERLMESSAALLGRPGLQEVLDSILRGVVGIGFDRVRLYLLAPDRRTMVGQAQIGMDNAFLTRAISIDSHASFQALLADPRPQLFQRASDQAQSLEHHLADEIVEQWAHVPLLLQGQVIGTLVLDNAITRRPIVEVDLRPVALFASQAAAAIENARLLSGQQAASAAAARMTSQLLALAEITKQIQQELDLPRLLNLIARLAAELLGADAAGILLLDPTKKQLTFHGAYGLGPQIVAGTRDTVGTSIAGRVVATGEPIIANDIPNDPRFFNPAAEDEGLLAVISTPLRAGGNIIGTLDAHSKSRRHAFGEDDLRILSLLANQAAIAIEAAGNMAKLREQADHLDRLVASSPSGLIAIDLRGRVTEFNARAAAILKYEADEVLDTPVEQLYDDPREPQRIGQLLRQSLDGKLAGYETLIRAKDGERIPIRLTAMWLYDMRREPIGSVGYFEDLRSISLKETEQRLGLLLKAGDVVTQAEHLTDGLERLAELIVLMLDATFCRIFLLDERRQFLIAKAGYSVDHCDGAVDWIRGREERTAVAAWPQLPRLIARGRPRTLRFDNKRARLLLPDWAERLGLQHGCQSLLIIPLKTRDRVVGLLVLGDLREWADAPFSADKRALAVAIADQTAVLIDRLRLHEITERRQLLLAALDEALRGIRAEIEPSKLMAQVVRLATLLLGGTAGVLFANRPHLGELEVVAVHGLPESLLGSRQPHAVGFAGHVARTGKSYISYDYAGWSEKAEPAAAYRLTTALAVPLSQAGDVTEVLLVGSSASAPQLGEIDLDILERYATHAAQALHTARLMSREQRMFSQLSMLHNISDYIQATDDLDKILHVVLTGITAGYGLGFNRAVLLLLDERREELIGRMGIGHLVQQEAQADWDDHHQRGLEDFGRYLERLESGQLLPTPLGERIRSLRLPARSAEATLFWQVASERQYLLTELDELRQLPIALRAAFEPALPLVIIPLMARDHEIGFLLTDNKFTHSPITREDIDSLLAFANTAALVIDNTRLHAAAQAERERLRDFYEASNALISPQNPERVLQDTVERAGVAANADGVSLMLIDELGEVRELTTAGVDQPATVADEIRTDGLSMRVVRTGQPETIDDIRNHRDKVNPSWERRGVAAGVCLPLSLDGKRIGVMWLHYFQPRYFSNFEIEAMQLYVNQAAIAYDSARRIKELEHMRQAAEALAGAAETHEVLEQIVHSAREVLQADSAFIWPYDAIRDHFIPEQSVAAGLSPDAWERARQEPPGDRGTAYSLMERSWVGVPDVGDAHAAGLIGTRSRALLDRIGARSFQGIGLSVGSEPLGMLFVNYATNRSFSDAERQTARTFANHAAMALKRAKLLEQVNDAQNAAGVVAKVMVLEDAHSTLRTVAVGTQNVLGCDAVTVYMYDQSRARFSYPPIMTDVRHPERAMNLSGVPGNSLVRQMLHVKRPYIVYDTAADPLFRDSRFTREEGVRSCVAAPLRVGNESVGVMFLNYRHQHRLTDDEQTNIELFANQAAVAIRNAQLFELMQRRAGALEALYEAGHAITGSLDQNVILATIAVQAWKLTGAYGKEARFSHLATVHDHQMQCAAAYPPELLAALQQTLGTIDLGGSAPIGVTGQAVVAGRSQLVGDVTRSGAYIQYDTATRSELAVPIAINGEVIGVINVEHPDYNAFDEGDQHALEALATQAAVAIQNARLFERTTQAYQETERRLQEQILLHEVALATSSSIKLDEVLQAAADSICSSLGYESVGIQLVDEATSDLTELYYYAGTSPNEINLSKQRGITGRVVRTRAPELVPDVWSEPEYVGGGATRSEMCVPLCIGDRLVGIINAESTRPSAFTEHDLRLMETIAGQLVNWIENARLYLELEQTKEMLAARTSIAMMGMISSTWQHATANHATTIQDLVALARRDIASGAPASKLQERLSNIDEMVRLIRDTPITPPLAAEEGAASVSVNELLRERVIQLWKNPNYRSVQIDIDFQLPDAASVRTSPEWLRRAFDILIDNAINAVAGAPERRVRVCTRPDGAGVEIAIVDSGRGIPDDVLARLFRAPIVKTKGAKGYGMGLLMAQLIVHTQGGEIGVESTGPSGTTMQVWLPLET